MANVRPDQQPARPEPEIGGLAIAATDGQLIAACLKGDHSAWEALITRYSRLIYSIPFKYGLSQEDAGDVFQSVCLILLEKLGSLRDHSRLSAWLITTTTRECWSLSQKRARQRERTAREQEPAELDMPDSSPPPDDVALLLERQQLIREGVLRLPPRCQKLIWYLFYRKAETSYADITRQLGIPEGSIGPTRARCLDKLRRVLLDLDFA
ncbi:MAG: sigma-70 family RNA polymerase sigma factor [Chloroflexota bacterium]|nr:MAG: sigma-70 family RNA polymerase sigma factor [Chloroflexota bacterium]